MNGSALPRFVQLVPDEIDAHVEKLSWAARFVFIDVLMRVKYRSPHRFETTVRAYADFLGGFDWHVLRDALCELEGDEANGPALVETRFTRGHLGEVVVPDEVYDRCVLSGASRDTRSDQGKRETPPNPLRDIRGAHRVVRDGFACDAMASRPDAKRTGKTPVQEDIHVIDAATNARTERILGMVGAAPPWQRCRANTDPAYVRSLIDLFPTAPDTMLVDRALGNETPYLRNYRAGGAA